MQDVKIYQLSHGLQCKAGQEYVTICLPEAVLPPPVNWEQVRFQASEKHLYSKYMRCIHITQMAVNRYG